MLPYFQNVRPGIEHQLLEDLTVFALADRVDLRADLLQRAQPAPLAPRRAHPEKRPSRSP